MRGAEPGEGGFIADWIAMLDQVREPIVARYGTPAARRTRHGAGWGARQPGQLAHVPLRPRAREAEATCGLSGAFFAISKDCCT